MWRDIAAGVPAILEEALRAACDGVATSPRRSSVRLLFPEDVEHIAGGGIPVERREQRRGGAQRPPSALGGDQSTPPAACGLYG
jgi:hypothetical protein